jgi:replicative DNA helicase
MLNGSHAVSEAVTAGITFSWFDNPRHGDLFDALVELSANNEWEASRHTDVLRPVLKQFGTARPLLAAYEPRQDLSELIRNITNLYMRQRIERLVTSVNNHLVDGDDAQSLLANIAFEVDSISELATSTGRTTKEIADATLDQAKRIAAGECFGIPFPWDSLNIRTFGLPKKAFTPLAGRDGKGKTRLIAFMIAHWICAGYPVLYFPFEDMAERAFDNISASVGGYDTFSIKRGLVAESHIDKLSDIYKKVEQLPLYIVDEPMSPQRLASIVAEYKRKYKIEVVVVDGVKDLMLGGGKRTDMEGEMMATLVSCMKRNDVAGLGIAHLRDIDEDKWLTKGDIRGIKTQSQSARMVLMYQDWVPPKMQQPYGVDGVGMVMLDVTKCSYGEMGSIALKPELHRGRFSEIKLGG